MNDLVVAPCDGRAARYAVEHWHYSHLMPVGKCVSLGVWEHGAFVGAVLFGRGGSPLLGNAYGLDQTECCELTRVALRPHEAFVSAVVARCLATLRRANPRMRLVVSFADTDQGHHGGIYQAGNWVYLGLVIHHRYIVNGVVTHPKSLHSRYGIGGQSIPWLRSHVDPRAERVIVPGKHRYVYPLDRAMRRQVEKLAQPYPRGQGLKGEPSSFHDGGPGSIPGDRSTSMASVS